MTAALATSPACDCRCCEVGAPCARVLQLARRDEVDLAKVLRVAGDGTGTRVSLLSGPSAWTRRKEPDEPTIAGRCRACGRVMHLATFLVDALKLLASPWPQCQECPR